MVPSVVVVIRLCVVFDDTCIVTALAMFTLAIPSLFLRDVALVLRRFRLFLVEPAIFCSCRIFGRMIISTVVTDTCVIGLHPRIRFTVL